MFSIGITGHQSLADGLSWDWTKSALRENLVSVDAPWEAVSSLAVGADQLFAKMALEFGAHLIVVLPFDDYERTFSSEEDIYNYRKLLGQARDVARAKPSDTDELAFLNAGLEVLRRSDLLLAIWDGDEAQGLGGTADIVSVAKSRSTPLIWLDPYKQNVVRL